MDDQETFVDLLLKARAEIDERLRRQKTNLAVLFTDIVGSVEFFDRFGDTAGLAMLHRHAEVGRSTVSEFGGRVIKTIGDSLMAEFSTPDAAVQAAVELQRRAQRLNQTLPERDRLQLRIGINYGPCFRHGNDLYGDAVNLAARITKHTGPAQILISQSIQQAIATNSELRSDCFGQVDLKGKKEKEVIFEVIWTDRETYENVRKHLTEAFSKGELVYSGSWSNEAQRFGSQTPSRADEAVKRSAFLASISARYLVVAEIGRGATGVVYKVRDRETKEKVALKILKPEMADDPALVQRLRNEVRLARKITHRNVCRIHEFHRTEDTGFIVMEFVDGRSLRHILSHFGGIPIRYGIRVARQMCAGLSEAHAQGVTHRDLKPENVMITYAGVVKVMDFGIAHLTGSGESGTLSGTPAYMAPEQAEGKEVDHRTDVYALGLILYEMFTGRPAFSGDTPIAVALKHLRESPTPPRQFLPSMPSSLEKVILKCLRKNPAKRFQSMADIDTALARISRTLGVTDY